MCVLIHVPRQTSGGKLSNEVKIIRISLWLKFYKQAASFLQSVTLAMQSMYCIAAEWPITHFYLLVKTHFLSVLVLAYCISVALEVYYR